MDKENFMKASLKLGWAFGLIALITAIVGCQQEKNPVKNYPTVTSTANQKYTGATPVLVTPPPRPPDPLPAVNVCSEPFKVSVSPDRSSKLMTFSEDTESSYEIKVLSTPSEKFKVETAYLAPELSADFHAGRASFSLVSRENKTATYKFTWKPAKIHADIQAITLRYTADVVRPCGQDYLEQLNLVVVNKQESPGAKK